MEKKYKIEILNENIKSQIWNENEQKQKSHNITCNSLKKIFLIKQLIQ